MRRLLLLPVTVLLAACTITEGFVVPTAQSTYKTEVVAMAKKVCAPQGKVAVFYSKTGASGSYPFDNPNDAGFDCEPRQPAIATNSTSR
jgi:putative hemolysin